MSEVAKLVPVILCGGSGTRLWPMSRKLLPKQFLRLTGAHSLLQETAARAAAIPGVSSLCFVCGEDYRFLLAEQLREAGIDRPRILLEPAARNTAPALAAAALALAQSDPSTIMVAMPADHLIGDATHFTSAMLEGARLAAQGSIVTFGVAPHRAETGYGYIERGEAVAGSPAGFLVKRFVEKPDADTARRFLGSGKHLWNSGIFVMSAGRCLEEIAAYRPDILRAVERSWAGRTIDEDFCRLDRAAFAECPAESIDYAVIERTRHAAVVIADMGWCDVGSWATLWETAAKDPDGNAACGDVDVHDTRNSYLRAEHRLLSVTGMDDVVVIETDDAVLVTRRDAAQSVKDIVSRLDVGNRTEHVSHRRVYRPWGYYETIDGGEHFQVKRLMVKPGEALSLQLHHRRSEHWVVVSGRARVTRGEDVMELRENQSTYIPFDTKHRLENPGAEPLFVIEVQSGTYLGEDDIVRFEDRYRRS